jgi:hypothetical protein
VRQATATGTGRLARWLLLACTLVGLTAMHSLGHGGGMHAVAMLADRHDAEATVAMADGCACDGCGHPAALPAEGDDMTGWSVCLAVVGGFAALALLALAVAALTRRGGLAGVLVDRLAAGPRAPPGRLPVGLALATVSVLRR